MESLPNLHQADQPIFLTNNLPYAERIEYGGSRSSKPQGMVRVSVS